MYFWQLNAESHHLTNVLESTVATSLHNCCCANADCLTGAADLVAHRTLPQGFHPGRLFRHCCLGNLSEIRQMLSNNTLAARCYLPFNEALQTFGYTPL